MWSSILGVVAGFLLWGVLWVGSNQLLLRIAPTAFRPDGSTDRVGLLLLLLLLSTLISLLSGYVAAWVVGESASGSRWVLSLLLVVVGILVQAQYWRILPLWYHLAFLALLIPATLAGGWLRLTQ